MAHQVFICHSSRDKTVADAVCAALEAQRISCWVAPRDVLAGMEYGRAIIEALSGCQIVLLIFSQQANDSPQVRREIERAVSKEKIILPFRIEDVLPSNAMEYALGNTHWLDALTPPMEQRLSELCQSVSRLMERQLPVQPLWRPDAAAAEGAKDVGPRDGQVDERVDAAPKAAEHPLRESSSNPPWTRIADSKADAKVGSVGTAGPAPPPLPPPVPPKSFVYSSPDAVLPRPPAKPKRWIWGLGLAGFAALLLLVAAVSRSSKGPAPIVDSSTVTQPVSGPAKQDPATMEEEAEKLYKEKNFTAAFPLAKGACDGGVAAGCNYLGVMYAHGSGVAQDEAQAVALYQKACDGGRSAGCTNLGFMYQNGKGIAKDEAQALTFYGKGCDGGYAIGCTALGDIYDQGRGVTIDDVQAAAFYVKGCAGDNAIGCANLGVLYSEGRGVAQDKGQAMNLFRKACDGGYGPACRSLRALNP